MGHLLAVLPRVDATFNSRIVKNLRQLVLQKHIDPDNICFNYDVLKEILELSKQSKSDEKQDSSSRQLKMMNKENFDYSRSQDTICKKTI